MDNFSKDYKHVADHFFFLICSASIECPYICHYKAHVPRSISFVTVKMYKKVMYECVKRKIPFVLAGSIRDDGPIPDVITDVVKAQKMYKKVLKDAKMVMMVSTMLHSIATGNMLPADVKVIIVDINQPTVTKLMDRGTWQALGIVTDVGAFMPMLAEQIRKKK